VLSQMSPAAHLTSSMRSPIQSVMPSNGPRPVGSVRLIGSLYP
jgi:hypothetical protein